MILIYPSKASIMNPHIDEELHFEVNRREDLSIMLTCIQRQQVYESHLIAYHEPRMKENFGELQDGYVILKNRATGHIGWQPSYVLQNALIKVMASFIL